MFHVRKLVEKKRLIPSLGLVVVVILASLMGGADGGYFIEDWAPAVLVLGMMLLAFSIIGMLDGAGSWRNLAASGIFIAYAAWTLASLYWSPNQGDAWLGAGLTLLYLLAFLVAATLVALGASRRWVFAVSAIGPAITAAFTLPTLSARTDELFENSRLMGTVGYYNGEAAFLLFPLWAAVYLAGSRRVNPVLRGVVLAGAVLSVGVSVLTQSRGAMVAMVISALVFFLFSGQRLRGLLALAPVAVALYITFPRLNDVYLAFLKGSDPVAALDRATPIVWFAAAGAGLYGLLWGLVDRRWRPPSVLVRAVGGVVLAGGVVVLIIGALTFNERVGNPADWTQQKWEAFKTNDVAGQEQSRYASVSGSGRYTLWQVAWEDFTLHPLLGVGTHNYEATYYQEREEPVAFVRQPHMLPLEVLAERGAVGGALFFGFLAICVTAGLNQRFRHLNAEGKAQVGAVLAAVAYWFVHSSAEWFWQLPAVTLPAVVYLAMLVTPWSRTPIAPVRWPLRMAVAALALAAVLAVAPLYVADFYLRQSKATENPWVALQAVERAQTVNPVDPYLPQREAELALKIGDYPRAREAYRSAIRLNPQHYAPHYLLALFFEQRGSPRKALTLYERAFYLNPLDAELEERLRFLEAEGGGKESEAPRKSDAGK